MKRSIFARTSLLWPLLVAGLVASWFVVTAPEPIAKDSAQYDAIAHSILRGQYALDGVPTMLREPGYPLFRAAMYAIGLTPTGILWVQVALLVGAIWLAASAVRRIDRHLCLPTAWLSAVAYGYLVYGSSHYSEAVAAFLVSLVGYLGVRACEIATAPHDEGSTVQEICSDSASARRAERWWFMLFGFACGVLALTRVAYEFLGLFIAVIMIVFARSLYWRRRIIIGLTIVVSSAAVMLPWAIRNEYQFGSFALTQRAGVTLYARALKAEASWKTLGASYVSALFGQATIARLDPTAHPIVRMEHWTEVWNTYARLQQSGLDDSHADAQMTHLAVQSITSNPVQFIRYCVWTPIEVWRLLALPSPLSPTFRIEAMFIERATAGPLSIPVIGLLILAHLMEWLWVGGTLLGLVFAIRRYGVLFMPGLLLGYTILIHMPVDVIERYAVPVTPWRMVCLVIVLISLRRVFGHAPPPHAKVVPAEV